MHRSSVRSSYKVLCWVSPGLIDLVGLAFYGVTTGVNGYWGDEFLTLTPREDCT